MVDVGLLRVRGQVQGGQEVGVVVAPVPAQREGHHGQFVLAVEVVDQRQPDVLLLLGAHVAATVLGAEMLLALRNLIGRLSRVK